MPWPLFFFSTLISDSFITPFFSDIKLSAPASLILPLTSSIFDLLPISVAALLSPLIASAPSTFSFSASCFNLARAAFCSGVTLTLPTDPCSPMAVPISFNTSPDLRAFRSKKSMTSAAFAPSALAWSSVRSPFMYRSTISNGTFSSSFGISSTGGSIDFLTSRSFTVRWLPLSVPTSISGRKRLRVSLGFMRNRSRRLSPSLRYPSSMRAFCILSIGMPSFLVSILTFCGISLNSPRSPIIRIPPSSLIRSFRRMDSFCFPGTFSLPKGFGSSKTAGADRRPSSIPPRTAPMPPSAGFPVLSLTKRRSARTRFASGFMASTISTGPPLSVKPWPGGSAGTLGGMFGGGGTNGLPLSSNPWPCGNAFASVFGTRFSSTHDLINLFCRATSSPMDFSDLTSSARRSGSAFNASRRCCVISLTA